MKRFLTPLLVVIVVGVALYVAYNWAFPTGMLRYRMTVEVEVDGEIRTGSSVVEVRYWQVHSGINTWAKAEAVVVDLGSHGLLFLLLDGAPGGAYRATPSAIPIKELSVARSIGAITPEIIREMGNIEARAEIPWDRLPLLARFDNPLDPATGERVDPDNLAASFGPGVRLVRVTIETTHDPLTIGVSDRLPWLSDYEQATVAWRAIIEGLVWGAYGPPALFKQG